jgi:DNA-binding transcriptional ArsR family regulator
LLVIDVDDPEKFEAFYPLEKLKEECSYLVATKDRGHYHLGFAYDPDFAKNRTFIDKGFELKTNGALVTFYTTLPEVSYKPLKLENLKPLPQELKEKLLSLYRAKSTPAPKGTPEKSPEGNQSPDKRPEETPEKKPEAKRNINIKEIIELAAEVYQKGKRQDWTIYTAGLLRKLGFSLEETKQALEEFLRAQGDEELGMRMAGIEHTFQEEPVQKVKGLKGLQELGLSDKAYLKLKALQNPTETKPETKPEERRPRYLTLKEIMNLQVKEPTWIIPSLLPEGLTFLVGKPKIGKSWLALQIALTCIEWGKRVVHYALEDTENRLKNRLKVLGIENTEKLPENAIFSCSLPRIGKGAIKELRRCVAEFKPDLIIIDPWIKVKPVGKGKDVFLEEYRALEVLKDFSREEGVSILVVHHARKAAGDDPLDEVLGSTGQTAVVDNVILLKRRRGEKTGILQLILRDFEGGDLGLRFENGWKIAGDAKEVMLAEEQRKIVEAIKALEKMGEKATPKAIAEIVGKTQGAVKVALLDLVQKGIVSKRERGIYSLLDINTKRTNLTNLPNLTNFTNLTNLSPLVSPDEQKLGKVSSEDKNELTFLEQNLQGLEEKVSLVSKVSIISNNGEQPTDPDQEEVYLLMPEGKACENCKCEIFKTQKRSFEYKKAAYGKCAKCGHITFLGNLSEAKVLNKEDVEYFLMDS